MSYYIVAEIKDFISSGYSVDSDLASLALMAVSFVATFLIARIVLLIVERLRQPKDLRWSSSTLALLVAAAFWGSAAITAFGMLDEFRHALEGSGTKDLYSIIYFVLVISLVGQVFIAPFSLLFGLPVLVAYLVWPKLPRWFVVTGIIVTMAAGQAWNVELRLGNYGQARSCEHC